jgi:putative transcription factor
MRCEICGKKIIDEPITTKIDGSAMKVCKDCSKFGKIQRPPSKPAHARRPQGAARGTRSPQSRPRRRETTYELVEDYNTIIRQAREKKGWSREDLGRKINEKVSVVSRLETAHMAPDTKLARKIENILKVVLLEKIEDTTGEEFKANTIKGSTIGDIARIKKH